MNGPTATITIATTIGLKSKEKLFIDKRSAELRAIEYENIVIKMSYIDDAHVRIFISSSKSED